MDKNTMKTIWLPTLFKIYFEFRKNKNKINKQKKKL